ncbi:hypothetical protein AHF37_06149 [Paragonimus kellicotti]|nr:hypothetical protein AHF37_06149 [Paragonimus kellicotti]
MTLENSGLLDRVADLERRSVEQASELTGLKASLAECLRRISLLETNKVPNASAGRNVPQRSELMPNRRPTSKSRQGHGGVSSSRDGPMSKSTPHRNEAKSSSSSALDRRASAGPKEPTYISNDGVLRVYLHGRPINVYLPSVVMETFDLNAPQPAPEETLKLEWAYGYRGRDCRNNLHYLPTGEIIYFVAAVVVLYNIEEQCQRHYLEHTDDVKCIAIHPDRITVATGQVAGHSKQQGKPHVRIWSSVDLRTLRVLGLGDFERGLCCLSFSKTDSGARLCAVDDAQEHVISVWEWQKGKKITDTKCSNDPVVAAEFHPLDESSIITCGKNHLNFWTLDNNTLSKKSAIFEVSRSGWVPVLHHVIVIHVLI